MLRLAFMRNRRHICAGALLAAFFFESLFASLLKSPTFDEPNHLAAGISYLRTRVFHANLQHPPLLKELSALAAMAAGARWPDTEMARELIANPPENSGLEWQVGSDIIARAGPDRVLFWARLPMILVATLLGLLIYLWGRKLLGEAAALGALFLFVADPTMIAHSYLVTTDMGLAAFTVLFFLLLWNYVERPDARGPLLCGLALGAALASKYSAVFLLPIALLLLVAAKGRRFLGPFLAMCCIAFLVIEAVFLFRSPMLYWHGLQLVNADHDPHYQSFLAGEFAPRFPAYFAAAYLLKEPIPAILLASVGLIVLLCTRRKDRLTELFLLLPPFVLFTAYTAAAGNMGFRYMIPVLPFAFLLGGAGLAWLFRQPSKWMRAAALTLCVWSIVAAAGIYPDHLSYFNEMACLLRDPAQIGWDGGTRCGTRWLDDSNVDWGQGVKQLRDWLQRRGVHEPIHLAYFGSFPPEKYGLLNTGFDPRGEPAPGLYAVSAHFVARAAAEGSWIGRTPPSAIVGHALYVYEIR